jgi:hypothetical protein
LFGGDCLADCTCCGHERARDGDEKGGDVHVSDYANERKENEGRQVPPLPHTHTHTRTHAHAHTHTYTHTSQGKDAGAPTHRFVWLMTVVSFI